MMIFGVFLMGIASLIYMNQLLSPLALMITSCMGAYLTYAPFGCVLFDNLTAMLGLHYTCGFMITFADALDYSGSVICYFYKNFWTTDINWHDFLVLFSLLTSILSIICSFLYFQIHISKKLRIKKQAFILAMKAFHSYFNMQITVKYIFLR